MTTVEPISLQPTLGLAEAWRKVRKSPIGQRPEIVVFAVLLAWLSLPAIFGSPTGPYVFFPQAFRAGEWWRLMTHAFVHVSWYHLLLDGAAFFMLYQSLTEHSLWRRLGFVFGGLMGSVVISWAFSPALASQGLCGLSGIAHGLMAVSAVEQMSAGRLSSGLGRFGLFSFLCVVGKAGLEGATGHLFFAWLHFGLLGNPIVVSHAGGIIGSLLVYLLFRHSEEPRT